MSGFGETFPARSPARNKISVLPDDEDCHIGSKSQLLELRLRHPPTGRGEASFGNPTCGRWKKDR